MTWISILSNFLACSSEQSYALKGTYVFLFVCRIYFLWRIISNFWIIFGLKSPELILLIFGWFFGKFYHSDCVYNYHAKWETRNFASPNCCNIDATKRWKPEAAKMQLCFIGPCFINSVINGIGFQFPQPHGIGIQFRQIEGIEFQFR